MRNGGVLLHVSSLPSEFGIGTFGKAAYKFVDFLCASGQKYWQILPLGQTGHGDSPYQSVSTFAGNPLFIDLEMLAGEGLIDISELDAINWGNDPEKVDYTAVSKGRTEIFGKIAVKFFENISVDYENFCLENCDWLDDYALFMTIKSLHKDESWEKWEDKYRHRETQALAGIVDKHFDQISHWKMLQYIFFSQWNELKTYANSKGIKIIGDLPIYVSMDSVDIWCDPSEFMLDENLNPYLFAGTPPDAFSQDGQLWGNPLYNWKEMAKNDYSWWQSRLEHIFSIVDVCRIDHFIGFEAFYVIDSVTRDAKNGIWMKGPGMDFFNSIEKNLGRLNIIAEDLGLLSDDVKKLLKKSGFPGMKVLQFAFDPDDDSYYLPHNHILDCVVYTGTHDNDTAIGWIENAAKAEVNFAKEYLQLSKKEGYNWGMMRAIWSSVARTCIVQMQDVIGLDNSARMNVPSTISGNWIWRMSEQVEYESFQDKLLDKMRLYRRI